MSLVHRRKVVHSISASPHHLGQMYESFTRMCEEQVHTDLTVVANDGKAFGIHKVILVGCSQAVRAILRSHCYKCPCEKPTLLLPDFSSSVVKSLLCLLYTGHYKGESGTMDDLKALAKVLEINFESLNTDGEDAEFVSGDDDQFHVPSFDPSDEKEKNDEMVEVTPEVHNFFGNHFLADGGQIEIMIANSEDKHYERSRNNSFGYGLETSDGYLCRLCGRTTPSPASLFSHLLYPHYAHLWREDVPQRKQTYECCKCSYNTKNRQRYIMHVARVHDELREKLIGLGENVEVLDNTTTKSYNTTNTRIVSKFAKMRSSGEIEENDSEQSVYQQPISNLSFGGGSYDQHFVQQHISPNSKPRLVRCRLCGSWKRRENFFTHMVSVHFRYLWGDSVAKHSSIYTCEVSDCKYETKYRYNLLFHLAGKHKQLKSKLLQEGISDAVLEPLEPNDPEQGNFVEKKINHFKMSGTKPAAKRIGKGRSPNSPTKPGAKKLICKVCEKVSFNHASHRLHVVSKHFQNFWTGLSPEVTGTFRCPHENCQYSSNSRQVFTIHLAFVHSELKSSLQASGQDISLGEPLGRRHSTILAAAAVEENDNATPGRPRARPPNESPQQEEPLTTDCACRFCSGRFEGYPKLIKHLALSHFNHLWDCDTYSDDNPYAVSPSGPYECSICGETFGADERQNFIMHKVLNHDILKPVLGKELNLLESNGKVRDEVGDSPVGNLDEEGVKIEHVQVPSPTEPLNSIRRQL